MHRVDTRGTVFCLLLGGVCLLSLGCDRAAERARRSRSERLPRLEVVLPARIKLLRSVELAATVEPMKKVELCARVPGMVAWLPDDMDIGRKVAPREKLLELAVPELEADRKHKEALLEQVRKQKLQAEEAERVANQEIEEARKLEKRWAADHTFQKLRHERISDLVRKGAQDMQLEEEALRQRDAAEAAWEAARAQVGTRQAKAKAAVADLEVAQRRIEVAEAEVNKVSALIAFATIRAPFEAVITKRWVDPGAIIKDAGASLLTLQQVSRVRVLIDVPQRDVQLVNTREQNPNPDGQGDMLTVRFPALAEVVPHGEFRAPVARMTRSLDPVTRTMRAEADLDNAGGHLRPNMYGTASILLEERAGEDGKGVLTIPATALVKRGADKFDVFHVAGVSGDPPIGVVKRTEIELGLDDGNTVEVRKGLTGNELIIARGIGVIRVDDRVIAVRVRE